MANSMRGSELIGGNEPPEGFAGWIIVTLLGGIAAGWSMIKWLVTRGHADMTKRHEDEIKQHAEWIEELKTDRDELRTRAENCESDRSAIKVRLAEAETKLELLTSRE